MAHKKYTQMNFRVLACDIVSIFVAVLIGYAVRLPLTMAIMREIVLTAFSFGSVLIFGLTGGGLYRVVWSRASVEEYKKFFIDYWLATLVFVALNFFVHVSMLPRTSLITLVLLAFTFMSGVRAARRTFYVSPSSQKTDAAHNALIVGAGEAGSMVARDILRNGSGLNLLGFIDDNESLKGMTVCSLRVFGGFDDMNDVIAEYNVDTVLIVIPSAAGEAVRKYVDALAGRGITVRVLPSILSLADGTTAQELRPVRLEDLLRRKPIELDNQNIRTIISGRRVLVTGAGGSIGSEICRQVLARSPEKLIALGHGEQSIYMLLEQLADAGVRIPVIPVIADVADEQTMRMIFEREKPEIVFHAGAHKHVPLMEDNPREALRVNSFGTYNIASLAGEFGVERFVMISTDKAVHPTSVMGATKRAAERILLSVQENYPKTKYMAVRFGNVLGSRGSVVPKFERQIAAGGPVTVTHPDMKRYFMLIPEAVSLVLQAGTMGCGGELFVLDMGEPVKISEMAEMLIRLHGLRPGIDIKLKYTGIRPGEKLYEELFYDPAHVDATTHTKIFKTRLKKDRESILDTVCEILKKAEHGELSGRTLREAIIALGTEAQEA